MWPLSDIWTGLGVVAVIGGVVVGFSTCVAAFIIRLFGAEHQGEGKSDPRAMKPQMHEAV